MPAANGRAVGCRIGGLAMMQLALLGHRRRNCLSVRVTVHELLVYRLVLPRRVLICLCRVVAAILSLVTTECRPRNLCKGSVSASKSVVVTTIMIANWLAARFGCRVV